MAPSESAPRLRRRFSRIASDGGVRKTVISAAPNSASATALFWPRSSNLDFRSLVPNAIQFTPGSFHVLHLFAKLLQLGFQRDDFARDHTVVGLRADGVHLAVHLLRQEIERAPDRLLRLHAVVELLKV